AVFLLVVVSLSGIIISFYYQFSFSGTYLSVARMEDHIVMRVMRALHRYASDALIIVSLLHAYRIFFMARFKYARWLAWVTGFVMTGVLWFVGVTGYALVWDTRGQTIIARFTEFLKSYSAWGAAFAAWFLYLEKTNQGWIFFGVLLLVHILLTLAVAGFFWLHIVRLNRPLWFPKNYWLIGLTLSVILISILAPVGMLPRAQLTQLPTLIQLDPIFLFYLLPRGDWILIGVAAVSVIATLIPWLWLRQKNLPRIVIDKDRCTGCTKCAVDCPYNAIQMIPRSDGSQHKLIAIENPNLCVSCGVCLGSCDGLAVSLGDLPAELLWSSIETRFLRENGFLSSPKKVIFTCERHARDSFDGDAAVIALPCVASAHPDLIARTLDAGASQVQVVGCPPNDCAQREGNVWQEERLTRQRLPRLKRAYENAPLTRLWLPPNEKIKTSGSSILFPKLTARNYGVAFALIAAALFVQVLATNLFTQPYASQLANAKVQIILADPAQPFGTVSDLPASRLEEFPTDLVLEVDGAIIFEKAASAPAKF
ncbi:MAG: cytochrome b N-terminal domain-containing protein, partial [Chloroflexi bacterium]|nr:cytochrome b N-terminal domain-containing protein [Chloroflexota bacterium]